MELHAHLERNSPHETGRECVSGASITLTEEGILKVHIRLQPIEPGCLLRRTHLRWKSPPKSCRPLPNKEPCFHRQAFGSLQRYLLQPPQWKMKMGRLVCQKRNSTWPSGGNPGIANAACAFCLGCLAKTIVCDASPVRTRILPLSGICYILKIKGFDRVASRLALIMSSRMTSTRHI